MPPRFPYTAGHQTIASPAQGVTSPPYVPCCSIPAVGTLPGPNLGVNRRQNSPGLPCLHWMDTNSLSYAPAPPSYVNPFGPSFCPFPLLNSGASHHNLSFLPTAQNLQPPASAPRPFPWLFHLTLLSLSAMPSSHLPRKTLSPLLPRFPENMPFHPKWKDFFVTKHTTPSPPHIFIAEGKEESGMFRFASPPTPQSSNAFFAALRLPCQMPP